MARALLVTLLGAASAQLSAADWPTYHGGPGLEGYSPVRFTGKPVLAWQYRAASAVLLAPVASDGIIVAVTERSELLGLDRAGKRVWSGTLENASPGERPDKGTPTRDASLDIAASPAIVNGMLLVGTEQGILFALDLGTGNERWRYDAGRPIKGSPNWSRLKSGKTVVLVVGQSDGTVHCLDLLSGQRLWLTEATARCDGSLSAGNGVLVFGNCGASLNILSVNNGTRQHLVELDDESQVAGGVALVHGFAYSGNRSGSLVSVETKSGEVTWVNRDAGAEVFSTPAVGSGRVAFSCDNGNVYCLDSKTGDRLWTFKSGRMTLTSPVMTAGHLLVGADGTLLMLELDSGKEVWSHELGDDCSGPAVYDEMLVIGSDDGTIRAFTNESKIEK